MRPDAHDLPAALRPIAQATGLEYLPFLPQGLAAYPIACEKLPIFKDPYDIETLPVQMNFHAITLDLDRKKDQEEYEKIMTYLASGYGMRLVHIERVLIDKTCRVKTDDETVSKARRRKVRRVYLEYYAPYRVLLPQTEEQ